MRFVAQTKNGIRSHSNKWDEVDFVIMDSCFCHRDMLAPDRTALCTGPTSGLDQYHGTDQRGGGNGRR